MKEVNSETPATYEVEYLQPVDEDSIVSQALDIIEGRMREPGSLLTSPDLAKDSLFLTLAEEPAEVFTVMFLDNRHRRITTRHMFHGTIDGCSIHPREVVRAAIDENAAAVILAHNHPSGVPEPSRADQTITKRLVESLALIDCRVLDHLIIGDKRSEIVSFAERGLI